jgi:hypothetical protein
MDTATGVNRSIGNAAADRIVKRICATPHTANSRIESGGMDAILDENGPHPYINMAYPGGGG